MQHQDLAAIVRRPRHLSTRRQLYLVAGVAAAIAIISVGAAIYPRFGSPKVDAVDVPAAAPGTFRPTKEQWAGMVTKPAERIVFRDEQVTDGKIATNDDVATPVFSPYSGRVTRLIARPGDRVERGAPLFAIEANEVVQSQNDLAVAQGALNKVKSVLRLAEMTEKRQHDLYDVKAGALKDWQQAQSDLAGAQADFRSAEISLSAVRNRLHILGKTDAEVGHFETTARMNAEAMVYAPIAGTVISRKVGPGQFLTAGASDPVFIIGDLSKVWLIGNAREADVPKLRVGQPVEVRVLAYPDRVFNARLAYVGSSVDPVTRRLQVRAEVDNADNALKPEMFASFSVVTGSELPGTGVPREAVLYEGTGAHIWVANDDGSIASREIRVGRTRDTMVEALDGVKVGEKVITRGGLFVDQAVKDN